MSRPIVRLFSPLVKALKKFTMTTRQFLMLAFFTSSPLGVHDTCLGKTLIRNIQEEPQQNSGRRPSCCRGACWCGRTPSSSGSRCLWLCPCNVCLASRLFWLLSSATASISRPSTPSWSENSWNRLCQKDGTKTRPDYLANCADKKSEGPLREKNCTKSRNSRSVSGGSVGAEGMVTNLPNCASTSNQIQTLKDCLCCHSYWAHLGTPWQRTITASRAVSDRESWYPRQKTECRANIHCPVWRTVGE